MASYDQIRSEVFTASFTVAGLLLAFKTYLVLKLEEGVYSTPAYQQRAVRIWRNAGKTKPESHIAPLKKLSAAIGSSIILLGVAAVAQLFVGLLPPQVGYPVAASLALAALVSAGFVMWEMRVNLLDYFEHLELEAEPFIKKEWERQEEDARQLSEVEEDDSDP